MVQKSLFSGVTPPTTLTVLLVTPLTLIKGYSYQYSLLITFQQLEKKKLTLAQNVKISAFLFVVIANSNPFKFPINGIKKTDVFFILFFLENFLALSFILTCCLFGIYIAEMENFHNLLIKYICQKE